MIIEELSNGQKVWICDCGFVNNSIYETMCQGCWVDKK